MKRGLGGARVAALGVALAAASVLVGGTEAGAAPAPAAPRSGGCTFDYCVGDQIGRDRPRPPMPGQPAVRPTPKTRPAAPGHGRVGPAPPATVCTWVLWTQAGSTFPMIPDPPSGTAQLFFKRCDGQLTGDMRWVEPGQPGQPAQPPPAPLSPAQLAATIRVRLEGNLPTPELTSSPRPGVAALIGFPTFVAVDNWRGTVHDQQCDPNSALCVFVDATPQLEWSPGEPGAATVACAGAGTVFDAGAAPDAQAAAPGACAYAYRTRTGVLGRPGQWPGQVSVRWVLAWRSSAGGEGSLPDVVKTADLPRAVDEVQTVIETAG